MLKRLIPAVAFLVSMAAAMGAAQIQNTIYFSFEMKEIALTGADVVKAAADNIKAQSAKSVTVTGYCDAAEEKPDELSKARAQAVADELRKLGVPNSVEISVSGKGAKDLARPTKPNVREPLNRRVTIAF